MKSFIDSAFAKDSLKNYFVFVEDCQFFIKGDATFNIINAIKKLEMKTTTLAFVYGLNIDMKNLAIGLAK